MAYRDDLAAAHAQLDDLRRELAEARRRIEELEGKARAPAPAPVPSSVLASPSPQAPRALARGAYYDPPRTYVPLLHLLRVAAVTAWRRRPTTEAPDSDSLLLFLGYHVLWRPFVYVVWRPVYVVALTLVVLPWAALVALAGSIALLPVVALARFRLGAERPVQTGNGWPQGDPGEEAAAATLWSLLAFTMPVLLPVFVPLLGAKKTGSSGSA